MTTVHQVFTVRSFRSAKDRDFIKGLQIYDANTHPLVKTDSREIAYWIEHGDSAVNDRFFVCGLFLSGELIGFTEFVYLRKERSIHFDYFIIHPEKRSSGAFYTFAEQMRMFFDEEKLEWDFITAEIAELDPANGISRHAQRLIRLFRHVGFSEVLAYYEQPLLGVEHTDTAIKATLMILPRVEMSTISKVRFLEIVSAIYFRHYVKWYSIYLETSVTYKASVETLLARLQNHLADKTEIQLRSPEREFSDATTPKTPPLREALFYVVKIIASGIATAAFHLLLKNKMQSSPVWILGISISVFILLAVTISLTDKKRFYAFKLLVSLVSKFFDR
jgi:hypothetical protein